jgi:probable rRNA maturation factor
MSAGITIDIQNACASDGDPAEDDIRSWIISVLDRCGSGGALEVSVRIVGEDESRQLNNDYRSKDRPTNVLSFPAATEGLPPDAPLPLGDIVICGPVVAREAGEQGKRLADHWAHLLVHGTLHLLGFDHETDADAERMEGAEREILAAGGVRDPYAAL